MFNSLLPIPSITNSIAGRVATGAAAIGWIVFAFAGSATPKFFFLEGCALIACTSYGLFSWISPAFAKRTLVGYLPFFSAGVGSYIRQAQFEHRTAGHLTSLYDSCAAALTPFGLVVVLIISLTTALVLSGLARVDPAPLWGASERWTQTIRRWQFTALVVITASVAALWGFQSWQDWQVNRPCL